MCGIVGVAWDDRAAVRSMLDAVAHRGPDGEAILARGSATLGHRRLAIIDVATGAQPMVTTDGRFAIVFNGEIYNHLALRAELEREGRSFRTHSDTEVVLEGFAAWGPRILQRLDGDFAFAIHDATTGALFLARDEIGVKPLFYAETPRGLAFASEVGGLVALLDVPRKVDPEALALFFRYPFVPGERTLLAGVRKLAPGTWRRYVPGASATQGTFWRLEDVPPSRANAQAIRAALEASVQGRLMSDVPLGVFLSGGIDSATVAALVARGTRECIRTFTVRFEDDDGEEARHAALAARALDAEHHEFVCGDRDLARVPQMVWHLGEPVADPAALPTLLLAERAKRHVTVVLAGEGGDEVFGGYDSFRAARAAERVSRAVPFRRALAARVLPGMRESNARRAAATLLAPNGDAGFSELTRLFSAREASALRARPIDPPADTHAPAAWRGLSRFQFTAMRTWLPDGLLVKADRMTMAAGVEARVPFLSPSVVATGLRLPDARKIGRRVTKLALREAVRDLVPPAIARRPKRGFDPPAVRWLRGPLGERYQALLRERSHDLYDAGAGRAIFERLHSASTGRRAGHFAMQQAWSLLVLELWHAMYIDGRSPAKLATGSA